MANLVLHLSFPVVLLSEGADIFSPVIDLIRKEGRISSGLERGICFALLVGAALLLLRHPFSTQWSSWWAFSRTADRFMCSRVIR
jgi:hypothetical protein